ncbi:MAG: hypothetical protein ABIV94_00815 [Acidimicrobiales bacterium]
MMRRTAAPVLVFAFATAVLVLPASTAGASTADWKIISWDTTKPVVMDQDDKPADFTVTVEHNDLRPVTVTPKVTAATDGTPVGCAAPVATPDHLTSSSPAPLPTIGVRVTYPFTVEPECNGTYVVTVIASVPATTVPERPADELALDPGALEVRRPAPTVTGVTAAAAEDRSVTVSWDAFAAASASGAAPIPKDLTGFEVTRTDATDATLTTTFPVTDPLATSFRDASLPESGGTYEYAVASRRFNTTSTPVASPNKVTIGAAPPGSPPTTTPDTVPGPAAAAGGGVRGGTRKPGATSAGSPTDASDAGFEASLPYEAEPGGVAAQLPSGGGGEGSDLARAGLLVPFAVALLLALWGIHIAYVTKTAREADQALAFLQLELE